MCRVHPFKAWETAVRKNGKLESIPRTVVRPFGHFGCLFALFSPSLPSTPLPPSPYTHR